MAAAPKPLRPTSAGGQHVPSLEPWAGPQRMPERQAMDIDTPETLESAASLLRKGLRHIEVMSHLDQIPATGALIVVARPGPEGSSGFRVRAFAILP